MTVCYTLRLGADRGRVRTAPLVGQTSFSPKTVAV